MLNEVGFGVKFIKDYNELNVLRFIKDNGPVSRAQISKKYKISKAAVSDIIARLINKGYVAEIGVGNSTSRGGRKPVMLQFNQKAGYVIGIELKRNYARIALGDMDANLHKFETVEFEEKTPLPDVLRYIFPVVHGFLDLEWVRKSKPIGIGIGLPGLIDYEAGCIKVSDTLKIWENVPVRDMVEKEFGISTVIENDVKTLTLGECLFGGGKNSQDLVYLWIGDGIGAGIIINGYLLRGITASAGEVGYGELGFHIREENAFPLLYKGQKDFGDILSNKLLVEAACAALQNNNYKTFLSPANISIDSIIKAAENKDALANELLREFGELLGIVCINLVNTLNMELLIISGKLLQKSDVLLRYVRNKVNNDLLSAPAEAVSIVSAKLKEEGCVLGAFGLVLEDLFYQGRMNVLKYRDLFN